MGIIKTQAIIIRDMDYSETSKIVTLFTLKKGKISVIVKGARKLKSKFANSVNIFNHIDSVYYEKESQSLYTLSEADIIDSFQGLQKNITSFGYASLFLEIINRSTTEHDPSAKVFYLLLNYLKIIDKHKQPIEPTVLFLIKLLSLTGIQPDIYSCSYCGAEEKLSYLNIPEGNLSCEICARNKTTDSRLTIPMIKIVRTALDAKIPRLTVLKIQPALCKELFEILMRYYSYHLEGGFNSLSFIRKVSS